MSSPSSWAIITIPILLKNNLETSTISGLVIFVTQLAGHSLGTTSCLSFEHLISTSFGSI